VGVRLTKLKMMNELQERDVIFCFRAVLAKRVTDGWEGMFYILPVNGSNTAVESVKFSEKTRKSCIYASIEGFSPHPFLF